MAERKAKAADTTTVVPSVAEHGTAGAGGDVFPDFAVSLEEANRRVRMLQEFVRDHMVDGEDYGVIPGANGGKPTLFKPGAEKLNAIFGLAPVVTITNRTEDWDHGFVAYEVKVTLLNKRTNHIEAEGIGQCNSRERRYRNQDAAGVANTILKMSKKRALVDATLSASRASGLFSQDLEDLDSAERDAADRLAAADRQGAADRLAPARESLARDTAVEAPPPPTPLANRNGSGSRTSAGGGGLTEAQRGAILSIANKAFGRSLHTEMAKLIDKPIAQLTKGEASVLIDRLRAMLPEQATPVRTGRYQTDYNASQVPTTH